MNNEEANRLIDEYNQRKSGKYKPILDKSFVSNPKGIFEKDAKEIFQELILELTPMDNNIKYKLKVYNGWGDDPAKFIGIEQKGPEKNFFGLRKKEDLIFVRVADYYNCPHDIQITCYDSSLENKVISKFKNLNKKLNCTGIHVWRHGYIKVD